MNFEQTLKKLWAKAPSRTINSILVNYQRVFDKYEINTPLRIAHFMAQISHECGCGTIVRENMNYSPGRMFEIFGVGHHSAKVTREEAARLAGQPEQIAERVYGLGNPKKAKELGNTQPGDGFKYRGGGMLQLTGRASYARIGRMIDMNLEGRPDMIGDPAVSFEVAAAEFRALKCLPAADQDNVKLVTLRVNGGTNGLAERAVHLRHWKQNLDGIEAPAWAPRAAELDAPPKLLETRTGQIGAATGVMTGVGTMAQIGQAVSTASDTVTTVQDGATQVVEAVRVVKPFLGMMPGTWLQIGIGVSLAAFAGVVVILLYRWIKIKREGE